MAQTAPSPAAAAAAATTHRELKVQQIGSLVFVTPLDGATGQALPATEAPSLTVELSHGVVGLASFEAPAGMGTTSRPFNAWAVLGCGRLLQGLAVAFVTAAELAGTLRGHPVFRATAFRVLGPEPVAHPDDARYVELLRKAVDAGAAGGGLYFSYGADLTLTTQAFDRLAAPPPAAPAAAPAEKGEAAEPAALYSRADPKVWWNKHLCDPLLTSEMGAANLAPFVVPFICGSVGQAGPFEVSMDFSASSSPASPSSPSPSPSPDAQVTLTLIARRATSRPGVRHWRRGADAEGAVANFVETEQIVEVVRLSRTEEKPTSASTTTAPAKLSRDPQPSVASFVQVRGSIPLLWSQIPELKYKPPTRVAPAAASAAAFAKHARALLERYGDVLALNLANAHGSEGLLGEAYASLAADERAKNAKSLRLVQFDFHAVCGATRYGRLEELWPALAADVDFENGAHSFFFKPGEGRLASPAPRSQRGVVRTNCVDCLDRTNVVQGWLGRKALLAALSAVCGGGGGGGGGGNGGNSAPSSTSSFAEAAGSPALEQAFKTLWADHGDGVSRQYAGTGALKSGFTRTGKRGLGGLADDGFKSLARYYLNNFRDGEKQDALDYVTGAFCPNKDKRSPFAGGAQPNPALPLLAAAMALAFGLNGLGGVGGAVAAAVAAAKSGENSNSNNGAVALVSAGASVVVKRVVMPLAAAGALLLGVKKNGKNLVNKPRLLPEAAAPW